MADTENESSKIWDIASLVFFIGGFQLLTYIFKSFVPFHYALPFAMFVVCMVAYPVFVSGRGKLSTKYKKPQTFGRYFLWVIISSLALMLLLLFYAALPK